MSSIGAWWLASCPARDGEQVVTRWMANRSQGNRAVGGGLFLTDQRLVFCPHYLDRFTGGTGWEADLTDVAGVGVLPKTGHPFDGGVRDRLEVRTHAGTPTAFVVNTLPDVVDAIQARLGRTSR